MSKRTLAVSFLTAGLTAGVIAGAVGPAAAQGTQVGGSGSYYLLSGAGNANGHAQKIFNFGNPGDETYFGDWDGNGTDTPMVRRGNAFLVSDDNGQLQSIFQFGDASDKQILVGDWAGTGADSLAIVRNGDEYFVKNNVNSSGPADKTFTYGNVGEQHQLVGDWDGNGTDTIAVQRGNEFYVSNTLGAPKADYTAVFGDPSDAGNVLVGNWATSPFTTANPGAGKDGDGHSRLALRRDGNHYFFSGDLKDGALGAATSDYLYGDAGDTVFAANLAGKVLDASGKPIVNKKATSTYPADVQATYKAGEPLLQWVPNGPGTGTIQWVPDTSAANFGKPVLAKGGEAKTHFQGEKQLNNGTESVLGPNGQPVLYTDAATGSPKVDGNHQLGAGTQIDRYAGSVGQPVLDAQGAPEYYVNPADSTHAAQPILWSASTTDTTHQSIAALSASVRYYTPKVGEPVLQSVSSKKVHSPSEQATAAKDDKIVAHAPSDLMLDSAGKPIPVNTNGLVATPTAGTPVPAGSPNSDATSVKATANADGSVTFSVLDSNGDPIVASGATDPYAYSWNFGDTGSSSNTAGTASPTHTFTKNGTFNMTVTVTEAPGTSTTVPVSFAFTAGTFDHFKTYAEDTTKPAYSDGTVYQASTGTTYNPSSAALYKGGEALTHRGAEVVQGWTYDGSNWVVAPLDGSSYTTAVYALPGDDSSSVNGSTLLQAANATSPAPQLYKGTEPVTLGQSLGYANLATDYLDAFKNGDAVLTHKAGDQMVDADGNPITSGTDATYPDIQGAGLGVRRNLG